MKEVIDQFKSGHITGGLVDDKKTVQLERVLRTRLKKDAGFTEDDASSQLSRLRGKFPVDADYRKSLVVLLNTLDQAVSDDRILEKGRSSI